MSSAAASTASRVFPEPPGPVRVTSRMPFDEEVDQLRPLAFALPTNDETGRGRFVFEIVFSGGKSLSPSWKSATGRREVLQPVLAELGEQGVAVDERSRRGRDDDLAAHGRTPRCAQPGARSRPT